MSDIIPLPSRNIIRMHGADSRKLLQGIITNNINLLDQQAALFSALLSPQGKFLCDFFITSDDNDLLIDIDAVFAESFIKKMRMYVLRADVTFTPQHDMHVYACLNNTTNVEGALTYHDPRHTAMGQRIISAQRIDTSLDYTIYEQHRLELGIPDGVHDAIIDKSLLLEMGYDALHAIDFHKGCYIGQEVTARTKHRATLRKCLHIVRSHGEPLPAFGTDILHQDGHVIGNMRSSYGQIGLAMIRRDGVEGSVIEAMLPSWLHIDNSE